MKTIERLLDNMPVMAYSSRHPNTKVLKGFGSASVFVLHCFKKKSAKGSETPRPDMELIRKRLDDARRLAEGA